MESIQKLIAEVKTFDKEGGLLKKYYRNEEEVRGKKVIRDGVVNPIIYFSAGLKILWILKEPYDKDNEGEYDWSISELLNDEKCLEKLGGAKSTWHPIIYATYGILNNFTYYDDMNFIENDKSMVKVLQEIAFINVQKFPAGTTSDNNNIKKAYQQHRKILLEQIDLYDPDIVIGGNTMQNFVNDLDLKESDRHYDENTFWIKDHKLYIDAKHPASCKSAEAKEEYIDDIIRITASFYKSLPKQEPF